MVTCRGSFFTASPPGKSRGAPAQGDDLGVFPAILFDVRQQAGMMPVEAPVHHGQHLFGQVAAAGPDDLMKQGIPQVEQTRGEMHRVAKAYLEILLDGLDGGALHA